MSLLGKTTTTITITTVFTSDITDSLSSEQSRQTVRVQLGADGLLQGRQHGKHCAHTHKQTMVNISTLLIFSALKTF